MRSGSADRSNNAHGVTPLPPAPDARGDQRRLQSPDVAYSGPTPSAVGTGNASSAIHLQNPNLAGSAAYLDYVERVHTNEPLLIPSIATDMFKLRDHVRDLATQHRAVTRPEIEAYADTIRGIRDPKNDDYVRSVAGHSYHEDVCIRLERTHAQLAEALDYIADELEKILPDNFRFGDALWVTQQVSRVVRLSQQWFFRERIDESYRATGHFSAFRQASPPNAKREEASGKYAAFAQRESMVMMPEFFGPDDKLTDNRWEVLQMMAAGVHVVALTAKPKILDDRLMDCGDCALHDTDHLNLNRNNAKRFASTASVSEGRGFVYTRQMLETATPAESLALLDKLEGARKKARAEHEDPLVAEAHLLLPWMVFHEFGYPINEENLKWSVDQLLTDLDAFEAELDDRFLDECISAPTDDSGRVWMGWREHRKLADAGFAKAAELEEAGHKHDSPEMQEAKKYSLPLRGSSDEGQLNRAGVRLLNAQGVYAKRAMTLNQLIMIEMAMFKKDVDHETDAPRLVKALRQGLQDLQKLLD